MIKATDLRVGNLVKDRGGKIIRIDFFENESRLNIVKFGQRVYLGETEVHGLTEYSDFAEPIPITEELLIKAGFSKVEDFGDIKHFQVLSNNSNLGVIFDHEDLCLCKYAFNGEYTTLIYDAPHFQHLHQLQNIYHALTGEELNFKGLY